MPIVYETEQQELKVKKEETLLEACLNNDIDIDHSCGGGASCGTCRVIIIDGLDNLHQRNSLEQEMADDRSFEPIERLACQTNLVSSFKFKLPND